VRQSSIEPTRSILPILKLSPDNRVISVVGTGFVVGDPAVLITAKHLFEGETLPEETAFGALYGPSNDLKITTFRRIRRRPDHDIAAVYMQDVPWFQSLQISNQEVPCNQDVLTYEFSSTRIETLSTGERHVALTPFTHKGNVLRHYKSTFPESHPTPSLDTSFPALQGARGAPVLRARDFTVIGMLVANHERHLLPAQVVRIETNNEAVEETRYFLPVGKALEGHFVLEVLDQMGISVTLVA
jgi:Trypsin-like peptidase domain